MKRVISSGYFLVLVSAIGFGLKAVLVKMIYTHGVDVISLLVIRGFISTPIFIAVAWYKHGKSTFKLTRGEFLGVLNITILGLLATMFLSYFTLDYLQASLASMLFYIYPVFTFVILFFLKEKVSAEKYLAFAVTLIGLFFLLNIDIGFEISRLGIVLGILTAFTFGYYNAFSSKLVHDISPLKMTTISVVVINIFMLFFLPQTVFPTGLATYGLMALLAVFSGVIAFLCFMYGLKKLGATKTVITNSLTPVFSVSFAYLFLGERLSMVQLMGVSLIVAGVLLLKLPNSVSFIRQRLKTRAKVA